MDTGSAKRKADEDEQGAIKRIKVDYQNTVNARVGSNGAIFPIHKDRICNKSRFFAAAFGESSKWREGADKTVVVRDVDPLTFTIYTHWVYTDKIDLDIAGIDQSAIKDKSDKGNAQKVAGTSALLGLYAAAEYLMDSMLSHRIVDEIAMKIDNGTLDLTAEAIEKIWSSTVEKDGLRRCIIDYFAAAGKPKAIVNLGVDLPQTFLLDLVVRQMELRGYTKKDLQSLYQFYERRGLYY